MKRDCTIRRMEEWDFPIMEELLYQAIYQKEDAAPLPRDIIRRPELYVYIGDWGQPDDICFIAEGAGGILGAVWTRILAEEPKGCGNVDSHTPEFSIALFPPYRGQGIGSTLMKTIISELKARGYAQASLSVNRENQAKHLYDKLGFVTIEERMEDNLMLLTL